MPRNIFAFLCGGAAWAADPGELRGVAGASRSSVKIVLPKSISTDGTEDQIISMFANDGINVEIIPGEKNMIDQVRKLQTDNPGSWSIVGSKMRSGLLRSVFGSTADTLAREAVGPIVVVPDPSVMRQRKRSAQEATRNMASSL